jgi:hypothetical protein
VGKVVKLKSADSDAEEINNLYQNAGKSLVQSVFDWWECGDKLLKKKAQPEMSANWLRWIRDNLIFNERKVQRLIQLRLEFPTLTPDFSVEDATRIIRNLWSNKEDSELVQQSLSNEHYTPSQYIEAARRVLGGIDLDPASCAEANKIVKAAEFYTEKQNGLLRPWRGRIWLNSPYGNLPGKFIAKLDSERQNGNVTAAIVLVNAHCTDTVWFKSLWDGILCFTDHRINFYGDDERSGSTHGSVFVYFGDKAGHFANEFSGFGAVVTRVS